MLQWLAGISVLFGCALGVIFLIGGAMVAWTMVRPSRCTYGVAVGKGMPTSPEELGMIGDEVTFRFRDGVEAPGWIIQGANPAGPTVIISHGWANSRYGALRKALRFESHASRIVVYDLRGHGDSTSRICWLSLKEPGDIVQIMDELERRGDRFVLFGSSMGAGMTVAAGALDGQAGRNRVAGVILDGPYRYSMQPVERHLRLKGLPAQPFSWLGEWMVRLSMLYFRPYDRAADAAKLRCPLLVLHGANDPICPVESAKQIAAAAADGRFVEFAGGEHGGLAMVDEAKYQDAITGFFRDMASSARMTAPESPG